MDGVSEEQRNVGIKYFGTANSMPGAQVLRGRMLIQISKYMMRKLRRKRMTGNST